MIEIKQKRCATERNSLAVVHTIHVPHNVWEMRYYYKQTTEKNAQSNLYKKYSTFLF